VTGGEPFVRSDFLDLLDVFHGYRREFSFAVLTNGSLVNLELARRLRALKPAFVQVSIEGSPATHDKIRGPGNFDRTVNSLKLLTKHRICSLVSFTAHRGNFREFPFVAKLGRRLGVSRVWADRLIPCGGGASLRDQLLTPRETREFFQIMSAERKKMARRWFCRTEVAMHRALQFLVAGTTPYYCTAGDSLITVQPNGDLLPCRRMPIRVGNLLQTPLDKLYYESDVFQELRKRDRVSNGCRECLHNTRCRGGLKCLSYAVAADPFAADPGCWLARRQNDEPSASRGKP
jgi:radical SAM protein with 4Fe4S-binding SPASM domain